MTCTTVTLTVPRTATTPAMFAIEAGEDIITAATTAARAVAILTGRGMTIGQALATLKVAEQDGAVTTARPA